MNGSHFLLPARVARLGAFLLFVSFSAHGDDVGRCDALAAHRGDPQRVGEGVPFRAVTPDAVAACAAAVAANPNVSRLVFQYGRALLAAGDVPEAVDALNRALEAGHGQAASLLAILHTDGTLGAVDPVAARAMQDRAIAIWKQVAEGGEARAATAAWKLLLQRADRSGDGEALGLIRRAADAGNSEALLLLGHLLVRGRGTDVDRRGAEAAFRRALEAGNAGARVPLAKLLRDRYALDESAELLRAELATREGSGGASAQSVPVRLTLADVHRRRFDHQAVLVNAGPVPDVAAAAGMNVRVLRAGHELIGWAHAGLQQFAEAEPHLRSALEFAEQADGPESPGVAHALLELGKTLTGLDQRIEAEKILLRALSIREAAAGADDPSLEPVLRALALNYLWILTEQRPFAGKIQPLLRRLLRLQEMHWGTENAAVAMTLEHLAQTIVYRFTPIYEGGTLDEAVPLLERAEAYYETDPEVFAERLAWVRARLLNVFRSQGDLRRVQPLLEAEILRLRTDTAVSRDPDDQLGSTLLELAAVRLHNGDILGAEDAYREVGTLWREAWPDAAARAGKLLNRGRFELRLGQRLLLLRGASDALGEVAQPDPAFAADIELQRALAHIDDNNPAFAVESLQRIVEALKGSDVPESTGVGLMTDLLEKLVFAGYWDAAEALIETIKAIGQPLQWAEMPLFRVQEMGARIDLARGRFDSAREMVSRLAEQRLALLGADTSYAGYIKLLGRIELAAGNAPAAVRHLSLSWETLQAVNAASLQRKKSFYRESGAQVCGTCIVTAAMVREFGDYELVKLLAEAHYRAGDPERGVQLMSELVAQLESEAGAGSHNVVIHRHQWAGFEASVGHLQLALEHGRAAAESARLVLSRGPVGGNNGWGFGQVFRAQALRIAGMLKTSGEPFPASLFAEAFEMLQSARATSSAAALERMAARFASGDDELGRMVRSRQDAARAHAAAVAVLVKQLNLPEAERDAAVTTLAEADVTTLAGRIEALDAELAQRFPEFVELTNPAPLGVTDAQSLLRPGEGLLVVTAGQEGLVSILVTRDSVALQRADVSSEALARKVRVLRRALDPTRVDNVRSMLRFNAALAHELFTDLFGPMAAQLDALEHLVLVPDGALDSLPPWVLLTEAPAAKRFPDFESFRSAPWLVRKLAVSVLPSVSGLRALRGTARASAAEHPFLGIGDPLLDGHPGPQEIEPARPRLVRSNEALDWLSSAPRGALPSGLFRGGVADQRAVRSMAPLPDSAIELTAMARALSSEPTFPADSVMLRESATESALRGRGDLARHRILAFATHGIVAGELEGLSEPALVLTPPQDGPEPANADNDGLLTASEVAALELDADWVILSACNTAAPDGTPGADGLSGLAKAFFYAGSRALFVSHWPVVSSAAVQLTTGMLDVMAKEPGTGRAEAHRRAILAMLGGSRGVDGQDAAMTAHPLFWAPFVVVGEGGPIGN